jgi:phosphosulfolactate phosphohydrolase-like enzyme
VRVDVAFTPAERVSAHVGIVVDVIRATSSIAQALTSGYERVLCCAEIDEARTLREELGDEAVVGGERNAIVVDGFDVGASPREFAGPPKARTLILTTTNGTRAILTAASECDVVLLGSLLNLSAVADAARRENGDVAVVCSGFKGTFALDDAYCAGRIVDAIGGEHYVKRLESLEQLAAGHPGVDKVYALQAGREIRVLVKPHEVDDDAAVLLSHEIAREIERHLEYPGQIKVTVIRESRAVDVASNKLDHRRMTPIERVDVA